MMSRLIDAMDLKQAIALSSILEDGKTLEQIIDEIPTASDWSHYSTKLWKEAYERGKRDARPEVAKDIDVPSTDCISRQAAIDALRMDIDIIPYAKAREYARAVIKTVYNRLENLPSAQKERMRGHWRRTPMACYGGGTLIEYECSQCEEHAIIASNYCPNCGAQMDRGEQE